MEIKQNQTFFHRTYSNLTSYFNEFIIGIFHYKTEHKQVKSNKSNKTHVKSDNIFPYLQRSTLFE